MNPDVVDNTPYMFEGVCVRFRAKLCAPPVWQQEIDCECCCCCCHCVNWMILKIINKAINKWLNKSIIRPTALPSHPPTNHSLSFPYRLETVVFLLLLYLCWHSSSSATHCYQVERELILKTISFQFYRCSPALDRNLFLWFAILYSKAILEIISIYLVEVDKYYLGILNFKFGFFVLFFLRFWKFWIVANQIREVDLELCSLR